MLLLRNMPCHFCINLALLKVVHARKPHVHVLNLSIDYATEKAFVPLVMEGNGSWSRFVQKYLDDVTLRCVMRKGLSAVAAKAY